MNRARITYRFDNRRTGTDQAIDHDRQPAGRIIPLYREEFEVLEDDRGRVAVEADRAEAEHPDHPGDPDDQYDRQSARDSAPIELNRFTTDFGEWQSPFDAETQRLEKLIRESGERREREAAHTHRGGNAYEERGGPKPRAGYAYEEHGGPKSRAGYAYEEPGGPKPPAEYAYEEHDAPKPRAGYMYEEPDGPKPRAGYAYKEPDDPKPRAGYMYEEHDGLRLGDDGRQDNYTGYIGPFVYDERDSKTRLLQPSKPPWFKISISVAGAILTGVFFGFFVLSMFSGESGGGKTPATPGSGTTAANQTPGNGKTAAPSASQGQSQQANGQNAGNATPPSSAAPSAPDSAGAAQAPKQDTAAAAKSAGGTVAVHLPARTFSFLQNGVFSTRQSAETVQADLRKKGLAAVIEAGDKYAVYVGVAANRDDALALSRKMPPGQAEIYVKSYTLPEVTQVRWSGAKAESLSGYFTGGDQLVGQLNQQTVTHLNEAKPTAPTDAAMQAIRTAHQSWTGLATAVADGAADDAKPLMQQMNTAMSTAVASLDEYKKNPSAAYLWQAQSAIMQYIVAEKSLLASISAP